MRLLIDASRANTALRTGVEWYSFHMISALTKVIPAHIEVYLYTREKLCADFPLLPKHWHHIIPAWPAGFLWSLVGLSCAWWRYRNDTRTFAFIPASTLPLIVPKSIVTIHDVGFMRVPRAYSWWSRFYLRWGTRRAVRRAAALVTPSHASKDELRHFFSAHSARVHVLPNASAMTPHRTADCPPDEDYFLYVGRIEHKKNICNLLRAFEIFKRRTGAPYKLYLVGGKGHGYEDICARRMQSAFCAHVIIRDHVPTADLCSFYLRARALVMYSLYEGFGMPLVEAMWAEIPIIASDIPAHREVAGDAALYADAEHPRMCAAAMEAICSDPGIARALIMKGVMRREQFSWHQSASRLCDILQHIDGAPTPT